MTIARVLSNERTWHVETTDVLAGLRALPDKCVHCQVTSPPYYALRDYGVDGQIGLEPTLDEFLAKMVEVFEEVRRVLRNDGTCWVNMGDSYNAYNGNRGRSAGLSAAYNDEIPAADRGLVSSAMKPKDKMLVPWRLVLMLQAAGWYVRDSIVWHKPAPMPESVNDRCTQSWEPIFLLAKNAKYFYDAEAVKEESANPNGKIIPSGTSVSWKVSDANGLPNGRLSDDGGKIYGCPESGRNLRNVWTLSPEPFAGAHFATFPTELPRRCIKAGTSEWGCCAKCGAPWKRGTEKDRNPTRPGRSGKLTGGAYCPPGQNPHGNARGPLEVGNRDPQRHVTSTTTTSWQPTCKCGTTEVVPAVVMDIFNGSGTTGLVARRLGRRYIGLELNPEYAQMARERIYDDAPLLNAS